jgi:hypothetical protein
MNTDPRIPPLVSALKLVAADFTTQMDALPAFVVHADEVALDYDDAFQRIAPTEGVVPDEVMLILSELDSLFEAMSDDKTLWTKDCMREDETWAKCRTLARKALELWGIEQGPPDLTGTYVKGL